MKYFDLYLKKTIDRNFLLYLLIGVVNTIVGFGLIFFLMYINFKPELANFLGYCVGIIVSFFLNRKFNFKSRGHVIREMRKFGVAMGIAYLVNLFTLIIAIRVFQFNKYIAQIIAGGFYVGIGYLLSKFWVFEAGQSEKN